MIKKHQKKILFLGGGFLQTFIIKEAKKLGYYTIVLDQNPNSIGFKYSDEFKIIDIKDKEKCLEFSKLKRIDGVLTVATDYGVISSAYISKELNIFGLDYNVAKIIKNKSLVRENLKQKNLDSMSTYLRITDVKNIVNKELNYPLIVKPCDGSGSRGIRKVNNKQELYEACKKAIEISLLKEAVIEQYIEGKEYGVESFIYENKIYVLGVMEKRMTLPPDYAELGHSIGRDIKVENKIRKVVTNAIKELGINFGSVNMDIIIDKKEDIYIIDIGCRMGGNLIGSHIIPIGTGINYPELLIKASVGDKVSIIRQSAKKIVSRLITLDEGEVLKLPDFKKIEKDYKVKIYNTLNVGDIITKYHNNLDGCGYILCENQIVSEGEKITEEVLKKINSGILRK